MICELTLEGVNISSNDEHPLKAFSPIKVTEEGISIFFNDEQYSNANIFILVKLDGISNMTCFKEMQFLKAQIPIETTDDGIEICVNEEHLMKVLKWIEVIEVGRDIFFINAHSEKAPLLIDFTDEGMIISFIVQHEKAFIPIDVTDDGISISSNGQNKKTLLQLLRSVLDFNNQTVSI